MIYVSPILVLTRPGEQSDVASELRERFPEFRVTIGYHDEHALTRFPLVLVDGETSSASVLAELKAGWPAWQPAVVVAPVGEQPGERVAGEDPRLAQLSPRELEVVHLLCANRRVGTIGRLLHISPYTVRNHLKAVFRKLGVHSQEEVVDLLRGGPAAVPVTIAATSDEVHMPA